MTAATRWPRLGGIADGGGTHRAAWPREIRDEVARQTCANHAPGTRLDAHSVFVATGSTGVDAARLPEAGIVSLSGNEANGGTAALADGIAVLRDPRLSGGDPV